MINLGNALDEQLEAARYAKGNSFAKFAEDLGGFVINRGASLLMALGLGIGFFILCRMLAGFLAKRYRRAHMDGVLSAPRRIISMLLISLGVIGGFLIAISVFNLRQDWLMLAMSLLLGLALAWSFVKTLPAFIQEARMLLNLGPVREGERTIIDGLPYRVDRLSFYSTLVNPALNGGSIQIPVKDLLHRYSRPVTAGEGWFPTRIGDWIVRHDKLYEVMNQTPEHVIIRARGGAEDFVPVREFLDTEFLILSDGYCRSHVIGLSYDHLPEATGDIPAKLSAMLRQDISTLIGADAIEDIEVRLIGLGHSSLDYELRVSVGVGQGQYWEAMRAVMNGAVVKAAIENDWSIPFPQLVIHQNKG